jgi:hypothetical protein
VDRRLVVEDAPRFAIVGQSHVARVKIEDAGLDGSRIVNVTVSVDGGAPRTYEAVTGQSLEIPFEVSHGGMNVVDLEVDPLPGEISAENNRAVIVTEGIRDRLRVLLVSGEPHPGERTWRNLLKADASVDLVHFTILRPPEKQDGTPIRELSLIAFPTRELFVEKLGVRPHRLRPLLPARRAAAGLPRQRRRLRQQRRRGADRGGAGLRLPAQPLPHPAGRDPAGHRRPAMSWPSRSIRASPRPAAAIR